MRKWTGGLLPPETTVMRAAPARGLPLGLGRLGDIPRGPSAPMEVLGRNLGSRDDRKAGMLALRTSRQCPARGLCFRDHASDHASMARHPGQAIEGDVLGPPGWDGGSGGW